MPKCRHGKEEENEREDVYDSGSDDDGSSSSSGSSSGSESSTDSSSGGSSSSDSSRSSSSESGSGSESDDSDGGDGDGGGGQSEDEHFELSFWESLKAAMPWTEAGKEVSDLQSSVACACVQCLLRRQSCPEFPRPHVSSSSWVFRNHAHELGEGSRWRCCSC